MYVRLPVGSRYGCMYLHVSKMADFDARRAAKSRQAEEVKVCMYVCIQPSSSSSTTRRRPRMDALGIACSNGTSEPTGGGLDRFVC